MLLRFCQAGFTASDRQFVRTCRRATSATLIVYLGLNVLLQLHMTAGYPNAVAALTGAAFFLLMLFSALMVSRSGDEFRRVLMVRSLVWGVAITMLPVCVWGFVETGSPHTVPRLPLLAVPVVLVIATAAAKVFIFRRNAVAVEEPAS